MALQLIIDGKTADILEGRQFPISIDVQIEDITSFTDKKGSASSRTFRLPGTAKNNDIFKHFDAAQVDINSVRDSLPAEIRLDTVPIETGIILLQSVKLTRDKWSRKAKEYEVIFLADNAEWFDLLDGRTLDELTFTPFTLNFAPIAALENVTAATNEYCFTLIKWKRWRNELAAGGGFLDRDEYTPALFIKQIIEKAFNLIGYTVNSSFMNTDFFERLILPIPPKPGYGGDFFRAYTDATATLTAPVTVSPAVTLQIVYDDDSTAPNFDNGGNYNNGTGVWTAPYDGQYTFTFTAVVDNLTVSSGQPSFAAGYYVNGVPPVPTVFYAPIANGETITVTETLLLNQGDTVAAAISPAANVTSYDVTGGVFDIRCQELQWAYGLDLVWKYLVPQYNLLDIIKGVAALFNLKITTDGGARQVVIEPRNDFFTGIADKTEKIDILKDSSKVVPDIARGYVFTYQDDSNDPNVENASTDQPIKYAGGEYTTERSTGSVENIENPFFAPTVHIRDSTIAGFAGADTAPQIPIIYPEVFGEPNVTENKYNQKPRILYFAGKTGQTVGGGAPTKYGSISLLSASPTTRATYPLSFMVNYYDDAGVFPSLLYGDTTTAGNFPLPGLLRLYYLTQLATINRGAVFEEWARFNIADLIGLDFRERWRILGQPYFLQQIKGYKVTRQDSTKVFLIEEHHPTQDDIDRLDGSPASGIINE
jgi:hypothetical protein